jgi:flagellar basal-body rod protein FlgC
MFNAIRPSVSALHASSEALSVRADNIANVRTTARVDEVDLSAVARRRASGPPDEVFRPSAPTFVSVRDGGVVVEVERREPSHRVVFDPSDPKSNSDGLVAAPNVDLAEELVGTRQDRAMFLANLEVIRTADEMAGALLDDEA